MKKTIAIFLALCLVMSVVACGGSGGTEATTTGTVTSPVHVHNFGDWSVTKIPDEAAEGEKSRTCKGCGEKETKSIAYIPASEGLNFKSNGDGTCDLTGMETCKDTDIVIPFKSPEGDEVTGIRSSAFSWITTIKSVTIPDSVTTIGSGAFKGCTDLTSVIMAEGLKTIGAEAFKDCRNLKNLDIPESVTLIYGNAFQNCTSLIQIEKGVSYVDNWAVKRDVSIDDATLRPDTVGIANEAFTGCLFKKITIPASVKFIGAEAFFGCIVLDNVIIPDSVISIGRAAFQGCRDLTNITLSNNLVSIGELAFYDCPNLINMTIPGSVVSIGAGAFANCPKLASINVAQTNKFYHIEGNCLIEKNSNTLVWGTYNSVIPTDGSVINIGEYAFEKCTELKNIVLPSTVKNIGEYAFANCTSLISIDIPKGVTTIPKHTFENCSGLILVTLPLSVTTIEQYAFDNCHKIATVYYEGTERQWYDISIQSFNGYLPSANRHYG